MEKRRFLEQCNQTGLNISFVIFEDFFLNTAIVFPKLSETKNDYWICKLVFQWTSLEFEETIIHSFNLETFLWCYGVWHAIVQTSIHVFSWNKFLPLLELAWWIQRLMDDDSQTIFWTHCFLLYITRLG